MSNGVILCKCGHEVADVPEPHPNNSWRCPACKRMGAFTWTATKYQVTKEECQKNITKNGCVCDRCGGQLKPIETVDNANQPTYWCGCMHCQVYTGGVKREVFEIAVKLVREYHYTHYHEMMPKKENKLEYQMWEESQIRGASGVVSNVLYLAAIAKAEVKNGFDDWAKISEVKDAK